MDINEAEALKIQIIERRNHLREMDIPLKYTKTELYSGIQGRVNRQGDKHFKTAVKKQISVADKNLGTINSYIDNLNTYIDIPQDTIKISSMSAPARPKMTLSTFPKRPSLARRRVGDRR